MGLWQRQRADNRALLAVADRRGRRGVPSFDTSLWSMIGTDEPFFELVVREREMTYQWGGPDAPHRRSADRQARRTVSKELEHSLEKDPGARPKGKGERRS